MAGRGRFGAITEEEMHRLLTEPKDDEETLELANELRSGENKDNCSMDKAWYGIDCVMNAIGTYPFPLCVLGGKELYNNYEWLYLVTPQQVADIAAALDEITEERFAQVYDTLDDPGIVQVGDDDLEYPLAYFEDMRDFYNRASKAKCAVLFHCG